MTPIILHIPHSSTFIPLALQDQFVISPGDLEVEIRLITDHYTAELFTGDSKNSAVIFPVSRLCVDPERFRDDAQEAMSEKGMGVIYTHSHDGSPLRRTLTDTERLSLLAEYYEPHHARLEALVSEKLEAGSKCLIIDCHSFPSKPLPYELDQETERPDICIGTDEFHTPKWLADKCVRLFESHGFSTVVNKPFSGSLVPQRYYRSNQNVLSVMIEVNRKLYLEESSALKNGDFEEIQVVIRDMLGGFCDSF